MVRQRLPKNKRKGAAAVEMAITAPVLLIFTFGILEVTNAIYLQESLEICAYEGARVTLLPNTTVKNVQLTCDKLLAARRISNATITVTPNNYESSPYATEIKVTISAQLSDNLITPMFVVSNQTFTAEVIMMKET